MRLVRSSEMAVFPHRLLIVSHVTHYAYDGALYAYGPYAREIDIWADLFPEVVIAAPCRASPPPGDCLMLTRPNITIRPQRETGGLTVRAKVRQLVLLPLLLWDLAAAMRNVAAIHIRCPGNLGLLGAALAPIFSRRLVAKYAGQWTSYPGEAWTVRLQRAILRSSWWRGPVLVYGEWPHQPPTVIPFFTSILTEFDLKRARAAAAQKQPHPALRILSIGRLSKAKNVDFLLRALAVLRAEKIPFECTVIGDGPHRIHLEALARELDLLQWVTFTGAVSFEQVMDYYERADVLVLASESEGWPKAIAEGMAFGLICIGSNRGLVPQMLNEGRGVVVSPGDVAALTSALRHISQFPDDYAPVCRRAAAWGQRYSLETLKDALRDILRLWWSDEANVSQQATVRL